MIENTSPIADTVESNKVECIWETLHDGDLESLSSDAMERSITCLIDVPFLWEFHRLPDTTRFRLLLEEVKAATVSNFVAWPGELVIPPGATWAESEAIRKNYYEKGRLESADWHLFSLGLVQTNEYEISDAEIEFFASKVPTFNLQLLRVDRLGTPKVSITAKRIRFFVGEGKELSLTEFQEFGSAYWKAFAERRK